MIIKATPTCPSILDLSSRERLQEENIEEAKTFHLTLRHGNTVLRPPDFILTTFCAVL